MGQDRPKVSIGLEPFQKLNHSRRVLQDFFGSIAVISCNGANLLQAFSKRGPVAAFLKLSGGGQNLGQPLLDGAAAVEKIAAETVPYVIKACPFMPYASAHIVHASN